MDCIYIALSQTQWPPNHFLHFASHSRWPDNLVTYSCCQKKTVWSLYTPVETDFVLSDSLI